MQPYRQFTVRLSAVCAVLCCDVPCQYRAQAADKGIPFIDLKNLSLLELQLYLLPVFRYNRRLACLL